MTTHAKKTNLKMIDAHIRPIESEYTAGSIASVRATLVFESEDERAALAFAHRVAADLIECLGEIADAFGYTAPTVCTYSNGRNRCCATIGYELTKGTQDEVDKVLELFHDVIPAPKA